MAKKADIFPAHFVDENGERVSFNLYEAEDIDGEQSKENILSVFKREHLPKLKKVFSAKGLSLTKVEYYSPKSYNFEGDSLDLTIKISNKAKLKKYIQSNKSKLQDMLGQNVSRDGYMALTAGSVEEVLSNIDKGDIDPMVVTMILREYPISQYDVYDNFVYEEEHQEDPEKQ